jgi:hypothetical protein
MQPINQKYDVELCRVEALPGTYAQLPPESGAVQVEVVEDDAPADK